LRAGSRTASPDQTAGIDHIGFSAENDQEQFRMMEAAGAKKSRNAQFGYGY